MNDLVERLRRENSMLPYYGPPKLQEEAADRIEQLEAALRWINDECTALMKLPEGENVETQTGYSRGIYFTAKHIQTCAALEDPRRTGGPHMSDELSRPLLMRVLEAMQEADNLYVSPDQAQVAISLVRAATLEEAAKECDKISTDDFTWMRAPAKDCAAAIRALVKP